MAAEEADARSVADVEEDLASEAELGSGTLRALWRWACYQARSLSLQTLRPFCQDIQVLYIDRVSGVCHQASERIAQPM